MKKFILLLIIIALGFFLFDFLAYTIDYKIMEKRAKELKIVYPLYEYKINIAPFNEDIFLKDKQVFREPINVNSPLKPIYIFGCSYAYGHYLEPEETFGARLAKLTGRPVYNFAVPGFGIQHMLFLLQKLDFPETQPPEQIFFVFIFDHVRRINAKWFSATDPQKTLIYKEKNGVFIQNDPISTFYTYRKIDALLNTFVSRKIWFKERHFKNILKYIEAIQEELKKKYPDSKFTFIVYDDWFGFDWSELEKRGIKVLKVQNYISEFWTPEYMRPDIHPTARAWEVLTPEIVKETGL